MVLFFRCFPRSHQKTQENLLVSTSWKVGESTGQMDQNLKTKCDSWRYVMCKWGDNLLVSHWFEIIERRNELLFVGFHFRIPY